MAKKETNDAKRVEMKNLVAGCIARGWTPATLAAYFRFSSFSPFVNGKSMGTNDLRAMLGALASFADARASVEQHIQQLKAGIAKAEAEKAAAEALAPMTDAEKPVYPTYVREGEPGHAEYKVASEKYYAEEKRLHSRIYREYHIREANKTIKAYSGWLKALQKAVK